MLVRQVRTDSDLYGEYDINSHDIDISSGVDIATIRIPGLQPFHFKRADLLVALGLEEIAACKAKPRPLS